MKQETFSSQGLQALVVDDDDVDRERLARMLRRGPRKIVVTEATSRAEALTLIRRPASRFDIVFLDFGLADGDGRDLVPAIRAEMDADCPIVGVTGNSDEQVAVDCIKAGMTEFLAKRSLSSERVAASVEEGISWRKYRHELRRAEAELTHRSLHDPLTDLPNRTLFFDRLEQACARARRSGDPFAVAMLDLDRFKDVNDSLGHAAGDAVLVAIARRLRAQLREVDTIARLGGDEFAFILHGVGCDEGAATVSSKLTELIEQPIVHGGKVLHVGGSLGFAHCPRLGISPAGLLSAADDAMYEAKRGVAKSVIASSSRRAHIATVDRLGMLEQLQNAIEQRQVQWHWQPKVDMRTGQVLGFEALVRWHPPSTGPLPVDQLIHTVEQSPLLEDFTYHCLDTVLKQFAGIQDRLAGAAICINISARMLERQGFVARAVDYARRHSVDPARLTLELTETALIANPNQARRVIEQLHDENIGLAIDDFGAGFTSFGYLREFSVSEIKIDRSYIAGFTENRFDQSLVNSLVVLCDSLGIPLVAEGVETDQTQEMLVAMGCNAGQGYGICRPMPFEDVEGWVARWHASHASGA